MIAVDGLDEWVTGDEGCLGGECRVSYAARESKPKESEISW